MSSPCVAGVVQASSLEEHQGVTSEFWDTDFEPLAAGRLTSKTAFLSTSRMIVYCERWDRPLRVRGALGKGQVAFAVPSSRGHLFRLAGRSVEPHQVPWVSDAGEIDVVGADSYANVVMVFDADFLQRTAAKLGHPFAREPLTAGSPSVCDGKAEKLVTLRRELETLLQGVETSRAGGVPASHDSPRLEEHLADALLAGLVMGEGDDRPGAGVLGTQTQRYRMLRTCLEYARAKAFDVTIPELCGLIGKSRRTLEYAFRELTGCSPLRYLYFSRLREVHFELIAARPEETTVTAVATRWGFFELGRFAASYSAFFGELPSQTLKRRPLPPKKIPALRASTPTRARRARVPSFEARL